MSASATVPPRSKLTLAEALASARETRALLAGRGIVRDTGRIFAEHFSGARAGVAATQTRCRSQADWS